MAHANVSVRGFGLSERLAQLTKSFREAQARRALYSRTVRELRALSDRDLADFGLHRANIEEVAHEAAYGK
jgi:uncharacterized protein YjiS (DUF1127 family)